MVIYKLGDSLSIADKFFPAPLMAAADASPSGADILDQTNNIVTIVGWSIVILAGIMGIIYFALKIRNEMAHAKTPTPLQEPSALDSAIDSERKGDFMKAGMNYESIGELHKAAAMFAKGKEFTRAAAIFEKLEDHEQAITLYKRAGESLRAAAVHMRTRNYAEAAKIFKNKGDTLRAARALEMMGSKAAAAREYTASGQYIKAARLYKDERMFKEAGEVYGMALENEPIVPANLGKYYTYAAFLIMDENIGLAEQVYNSIAGVDPDFKDVQEKIRLIGMRTGKVLVPELEIDRAERERKEHESLMVDAPPAIDQALTSAEPEDAPAAAESIPESVQKSIAEQTVAPAKAEAAEPEPAPQQQAEESMDEAALAASPEELSKPESQEVPPAAEQQDEKETLPSVKVETSPSVDTSASMIAEKVMGQADINDLFDQMGGAEDEADEESLNEATLRSILNSSRMEPRYSMRMWMQILKQLYSRHSAGTFYGCITPDTIYIDMENNVRLDDPDIMVPVYTAPEVLDGSTEPDEQSDIYSMGVILYELVTGRVDTIGEKYPIELYDDIPEWMEVMIMHCLDKDRKDRYKGIDEISSLVMQRATHE